VRRELDTSVIHQLRVPISFRLAPRFALFVSPAVSVSLTRDQDDSLLAEPGLYGLRLTPHDSNTAVYIWPGFTLGARFL
jgi:hypothetical protein